MTIGQRLLVTLSNEIPHGLGRGPYRATVVQRGRWSVIIRFDTPLDLLGSPVSEAFAENRHTTHRIEDLLNGESASTVAILRVRNRKNDASSPSASRFWEPQLGELIDFAHLELDESQPSR